MARTGMLPLNISVEDGQEALVRQRLQNRVASEQWERYFGATELAYEKVSEIKGSKRRFTERVLPGLILIEMRMDRAALRLVCQTPGVKSIELACATPRFELTLRPDDDR